MEEITSVSANTHTFHPSGVIKSYPATLKVLVHLSEFKNNGYYITSTDKSSMKI